MSDNLPLLAAKDIGDVLYPRNIITDPAGNDLTPLTDAALRATPVAVTVTNSPVTSGLTNAELRSTAVPVKQEGAATETTLSGLSAAVSTLNTAAEAIRSAVEAINGRHGTVTVGNFPVSQSVNTGLVQSLTNAELRASAITVSGQFYPSTQQVSAEALPLPTGAATQATLAAVEAKLPPLSGGRIPVELPSGNGGGLTDVELRASPLATNAMSVAEYQAAQALSIAQLSDVVSELALAIRRLQVAAPLPDPTGRVRASVETGSLSSVSTVSTVTNMNNMNGYSTALLPFSVMQCAANALRAKIDLT